AVEIAGLRLSQAECSVLRNDIAEASAASSISGSRRNARSDSDSQGLLMLDSVSLAALGRHFDRQMQHIQQRLEYLMEQSTVVTMHVSDRAGNLTENNDLEIAKYHDIMKQIDELELDFDRIAHIRDLVRDFRRRARAGGRGSSRSRGG
ncbi:hypothetical protein B0T25DRAFT_426110, partial [Lasiosphaeria hispida]